MIISCLFTFLLAVSVCLMPVQAAEPDTSYTLTLHDHRFQPDELVIPAGIKFHLVVQNEDATPEEFESRSLKREKIIPGKSRITLPVGPLSAGTYEFFGEFHESTAKGRLIVK